MFEMIRGWASRLESDRALKRRVAVKLVVGIVVTFVVAIGIIVIARSGTDKPRQPVQAIVEPDGLPPNPAADDPQYHEKSRERHAALMAKKAKDEETTRNWTVALVIIAGFVALIGFYWISKRWSTNQSQSQRRSDDPTNPIMAVFKGVAYLFLLFSGPFGWILAYLWYREEVQNRERLAIAEALDELEQAERRRDRAMYQMAERLNSTEQVRCSRCGTMNAAELVSCWHCEFDL